VIIPLGTSAGPITGIVKDFNYTSLKEKISGVLFFVSDADRNGLLGERGSLYIRLQSENLMSTLTQIRSLYEAQRPTSPFEFYFLDDAFEQLYQEEDRMAWLFRAFTCLAIGVACLGLLGLVTFTTERKTREIGIRKVLGASEFSIVHLITGEFSLVMVVGIVFAIPIGWWAMETWLEKFPYRVELTATSFFVGGLLVLGLGLITITIQATKAALANPVKSLRSE
jgi:putative ABC transport system permease protein